MNEELDSWEITCAGCGKPLYTSAEMNDMRKRQTRLRQLNEKLYETFMRMGVLCPECERKKRIQFFGEEVESHIQDSYAQGLIPFEAKECTFQNSDAEYESKNAEVWKGFRNRHILDTNKWICGPPGVGKTYLSRCVLNRYLFNKQSAIEVSAFTINQGKLIQERERFFNQIVDAVILLLEDVDKITWTASGLNTLYAIVNARSEKQQRMIITSNVTPERFSAYMKTQPIANISVVAAMMERFLPMKRVEMLGQSIRREK